MLRELCLVLDGEGKSDFYTGNLFTVLREDEAFNLDKFTTGFESSDDIRKVYQAQIDSFLAKNIKYLENYKKRTNRINNGRIVILENHQVNGSELRAVTKRVLYKKHIRQGVILNMLNNEKVLKLFLNLDGNSIDGIFVREVIPPGVIKAINNYIKTTLIKDKAAAVKRIYKLFIHEKTSSYFERVRLLVKAYKSVAKEYSLPKIEQIYKDVIRLNAERKKLIALQSGEINLSDKGQNIFINSSLALKREKKFIVNNNGKNIAYDRDAWYASDFMIPDEFREMTEQEEQDQNHFR